MAIKHAQIVIPADAGIASMSGQACEKIPAFAGMTGFVGLFACRSNSSVTGYAAFLL